MLLVDLRERDVRGADDRALGMAADGDLDVPDRALGMAADGDLDVPARRLVDLPVAADVRLVFGAGS